MEACALETECTHVHYSHQSGACDLISNHASPDFSQNVPNSLASCALATYFKVAATGQTFAEFEGATIATGQLLVSFQYEYVTSLIVSHC